MFVLKCIGKNRLFNNKIYNIKYLSKKTILTLLFIGFSDWFWSVLLVIGISLTSLVSYSILIIISIPSNVIFSIIILKRKFNKMQIGGVILCIIGVFWSVFSDLNN